MPVRTRMTQRAYIERNQASTNAYGHQSPPDWQSLSTTPCWVWAPSGSTAYNDELAPGKLVFRVQVPLGTDVTDEDRILKVEDRSGTQIFGLMTIDAVIRRHGHIELRTERFE